MKQQRGSSGNQLASPVPSFVATRLDHQIVQRRRGRADRKMRSVTLILQPDVPVVQDIGDDLKCHNQECSSAKLIQRLFDKGAGAPAHQNKQKYGAQNVQQVCVHHHPGAGGKPGCNVESAAATLFRDFIKVERQQRKHSGGILVPDHSAALKKYLIRYEHQDGDQSSSPTEQAPSKKINHDEGQRCGYQVKRPALSQAPTETLEKTGE